MSKLRVNCFLISLDGFGAGPEQSREQPLGISGERLHNWMLGTHTFKEQVMGRDGGASGPEYVFTRRCYYYVT